MVHWMFGARPRIFTLLVPLVPALRSLGLSLGVVSTGYCRAAKRTLVHSRRKVRRGPQKPSPSCLLVTQRLPDLLQRGESRLNISAIGGTFARIQSSIIAHPARIVLGEQQPFRHRTDLWANRSHFGQVSYKNTSESQRD
jgi:hypothetical protein